MSKGGAMGSVAPSFGGSGGRLGGVASILNRQNQPQPYQPPQAPSNGWGQTPGAYQPQQPYGGGMIGTRGVFPGGTGAGGFSGIGSLLPGVSPQQMQAAAAQQNINPNAMQSFGGQSPFHQPLGQFMRSQPQPIQPSMQPQPQPMQPGGHVVGPWGLAHPDIIAQRQAARQAARQPQQGVQPQFNFNSVDDMGPGGQSYMNPRYYQNQNLLGALGQNYNGRPMNVSGGLMGMF